MTTDPYLETSTPEDLRRLVSKPSADYSIKCFSVSAVTECVFQGTLTMPNKLVARMEGPHGTGLYRCEVTIETPRFITMETSKNVTVVGKINNV